MTLDHVAKLFVGKSLPCACSPKGFKRVHRMRKQSEGFRAQGKRLGVEWSRYPFVEVFVSKKPSEGMALGASSLKQRG